MNGASGTGWRVRLCTCRVASTEVEVINLDVDADVEEG